MGTNLPIAATTLSKVERKEGDWWGKTVGLREEAFLCLLEATLPPSFFDLMLHLTAHIAR
jgi:hypothetical protein